MTALPHRGDAYSLEDMVMWVESTSADPAMISLRTQHDRVVIVPQHLFDRYFLRLKTPTDGLREAVSALVKLVRADNPSDCSLADIGGTWGEGLSPAELAALAELDRDLAA